MRILLASAAALLAAASFAAPASAQAHRQAILAQLDAAASTRIGEGYEVDSRVFERGSLIGMLPNAGHVILEIQLRAGEEYFIAGGCDTDCDDLDLRVRTPDGETTLDEDVEADDVPILSFTARESGPHLLQVSMASCTTELCYFGFRVLTK